MHGACDYCGTSITQPASGRKRKFCDGACKVAYHRRERKVQPPVINSDVCSACGAKPTNVFGDIEEPSKRVLGYLCPTCFRIARPYGRSKVPTPKRLRQIADYLERVNPPRPFSNELKRNVFENIDMQSRYGPEHS